MHASDTGERVTPVLDFPSRDGLAVHAVGVDYGPGGFSRVHRHPAGAYLYVIDGSVMFGLGGREPVLLKAGDSFYEPPGALHSCHAFTSQELPASSSPSCCLARVRTRWSTTMTDGLLRFVTTWLDSEAA
jgi:quercetin dioxygenase-like cupin family protein